MFDWLNWMLVWLNMMFFNVFGVFWYVYEYDIEGVEKVVL